MPKLETLEVGEQSLTKLRRLMLLSGRCVLISSVENQCLKSVKIGKGALKRCE